MSNAAGFPILSLTTYVPIFGALVLLFVNKKNVGFIKWFTNVVAFADMVISFFLLPKFNTGTADMQFVEQWPWIEKIGAQYFFGIDGISLLLVLLTTVLGFLSILSSWSAITERVKEYYIFMLVLQTGMLGVFVSLDFFLFYVFWEVMLVPMYFLIGVWGGPRKLYAAIKFFLYTLSGSVLMLIGILTVYFHYYAKTGVYTFDVLRLTDFLIQNPLAHSLGIWIFLAFWVAFAIKVPMFPFHTWLPDAHVEAPTAGSVILAGVLLKMGTYGFLRFSLPMFPGPTKQLLPWMIGLSLVAIVYGALVAMMQKDWKKLVAYSSVSHLGFCTLGIFALNPIGIEGGMLQMINHGISTGALFLIVGVIYERRHTRDLAEFGGLSKVMPVYAAVFAIITMSSIGLPGLNGFIGEFFILVGAFEVKWWWALIATSGIVLGAAYMLWAYQRIMFGKIENEKNKNLADLNLREFATFLPLIIFAFWIGLYPKPFIRIIEKPIEKIVEQVQPGYFARQQKSIEPRAVAPAPMHHAAEPAAAHEGTEPAVAGAGHE